MRNFRHEQQWTATLATGLSDILEIDSDRFLQRIAVEISVTGSALDQFTIQAKFNKNGSYKTLYSSAGDFLTPFGLLVGANGDLTTTATTATGGWFIMDTYSLDKVKLQGASSSSSNITVYVGAYG